MSWGDLGGIAALLTVLGAGAGVLFRSIKAGAISREDSLTQRERDHDAKVDARLKAMEDALERTNRKYAGMVGGFTVLVDYIVTQPPRDQDVAVLVEKLRKAYPVEAEMPIEFTMLLLRLDALSGGRGGEP